MASTANKRKSAKVTKVVEAESPNTSPSAVKEAVVSQTATAMAPAIAESMNASEENKVVEAPIVPVQQATKALEKKVVDENEQPSAANATQTDSTVETPKENPAEVAETTAPANSTSKSDDEVVTKFEWCATDAEEVILTGSFNEWKKDLVMKKVDGTFSLDVPLRPGGYAYKFIVDGEWCFDILKPFEDDGEGNVNNTITAA